MDQPLDFSHKRSSLVYRSQAFIDGAYVPALSGKTFSCISPIDGSVLTEIAACGDEDVERCVRAARRAFESGVWRNRPPQERKKILVAFAELILKHKQEFALLETLDMGKPISDSLNDDIPSSARCIAWYGECCDKLYDEMAPTRPSSLSLITREPIGVIAAVVPWNFPLLMAAWKIGPALASGNSVILKPAEQSSLTALRLGELAQEAGIPAGVFNVLPGFGEVVGQALGRHEDVDGVVFTGSTEVGKLFLRYSSESNMKRVSLECGGKSPNLIFADSYDLEGAASAAAAGIFYNSGQVCSAASRLLLDERVAQEVIGCLIQQAQAWYPKNPLKSDALMGTIVDQAQMEKVKHYIHLGTQEGAELLLGGKSTKEETGGYYLEPTIFKAPSSDLSIVRDEIFGPVLSVLTFKTEEEAISLANRSVYGLQASVWTSDLNRAHRVARALRVGTVNINNTDGGDVTTPFGGYKQSGFGRDKSLHAFEKYTEIKHTYVQL